MGKRANRLKAASRKGEKVFTTEQVIDNLKSTHRRDILDLMATFNKQFQDLETANALRIGVVRSELVEIRDIMLKNLKNSHQTEIEKLKNRNQHLENQLQLYKPAHVKLNVLSLDL